ncbi:hypothetical protein [Actinomadura geliboluensis]
MAYVARIIRKDDRTAEKRCETREEADRWVAENQEKDDKAWSVFTR